MDELPTHFVMDERAMFDVDRAMVMTVAFSLEEAREDAEDFAPCVIVDRDFNFVEHVDG